MEASQSVVDMSDLVTTIIGAILGAIFGSFGTWLASKAQIEGLKTQIRIERKALISENKREKKEFCFRMFEIWSSDFMRKCRTSAWNHIIEESKGTTSFDFIGLKYDKPELWSSVATVQHFFADLYVMLNQDIIDRDLAKRLFKSTIDAWLEYFLDLRSTWGNGVEHELIRNEVYRLRTELNR